MDCTASRIPYHNANILSGIVLDYLAKAEKLQDFVAHSTDLTGIKESITARQKFPTDRSTLVEQLELQYRQVAASSKVVANIKSLRDVNTFTITTAHQNNIFTGPLYFIYKIIHAIRLAETLKAEFSEYHFVPVYYIGSEDADFAELNHIFVEGTRLEWNTTQTGAVGRMKIDKGVTALLTQLNGRLSVLPYGNDIMQALKDCYQEGRSVQDATFRFVHHLFSDYGLVVLLPDNAALKSLMTPVFIDDLENQAASAVVTETATRMEENGYKVQAHPREINLFYLEDNIRERIERNGDTWHVLNTAIQFDRTALESELNQHPARFSPNVILRGLYQETILPNIAFIGGGGETAYWLQLKDLFVKYQVPFPVLVVRNSFLLIEEKEQERIEKLGLSVTDLLTNEEKLMNAIVRRDTSNKLMLKDSIDAAEALYASIHDQAAAIDGTLGKHVNALKTQAVYRLKELEKKMLRAEKRKFEDQRRQLTAIREKLYPGNRLQERSESFLPFYAKYGPGFIDCLYKNSLGLEQEFTVLEMKLKTENAKLRT